MAKFVAGSHAFDMTDWDLTDFGSGTVTSDSATEVDVTGAGAVLHYTLTGTGLGSFDTNGFPQSGTVTGFSMAVPGRPALVISNISIAASDFMGFVTENDGSGLAAALFAGNDFVGRTHDLVLQGFGGNDSFNIIRGGNDTIQGGDGNDTVNAGAAFTAADSIDGGTGTDKLHLSGDYSAGVTFGASTLANVEDITLAAGHSYNLTLNAATATSGQSLEVFGGSLGKTQTLTVDGSAVAGDLRLVGGAGDDTLTGGSGTNVILGGAGNNTLTAGTGTNTISGGTDANLIIFSNWNSSDRVNGVEGGNDTLLFNGDFSGGVTLTGGEIKHVGYLQLAAGHNYDIAAASNVTIGTIDGSALGAGNSLTYHASDVAVAQVIFGGAGNDVITSGPRTAVFSQPSTVDISLGGDDTVISNGGNVVAGAAFNANDHLEGHGTGNELILDGDYSAGLVLTPAMISGFGGIEVRGAFNYNMTETDALVAAGAGMSVETDLTPGGTVHFDGSAETDGVLGFSSSFARADVFIGGAGNDTLDMYSDGTNVNARLDGGGGADRLAIHTEGNSDGTVVFSDQTISNIETIYASGNLYMADGNVAAGQTMTVVSEGRIFDGSKETDGAFNVTMTGDHRDHVIGGAGDDVITSQFKNGAIIEGGGGADVINFVPHGTGASGIAVYNAVSDSTGARHDTMINFDPSHDVFQLPVAVTAVDAAVNTGALSTASFDADLANAVGAAQLGAHHAVVFTADSGTLAHHIFLVIDANGIAGYQAGQDFVIELSEPTSFTTADFTT